MEKIINQSYAFKGYASSYNVEILISFNPELQLKDTESAVKNELINLLSELKDFKLVTALVLEFKKIQSNDKTLQSNLYKRTTVGTTQKWLSWAGGCLIKHLYKMATNHMWSFLAGF